MVRPLQDDRPLARGNLRRDGRQGEDRKINVDENPGVAGKLGIRSIPTLFLFKGGQATSQKVGAAPKGELVKWISASI